MIICILSGKRLNELSLCYQLEGGLECSVNVEVLLAEKAEALPQLGLPGEEVESPTNPAEGQKSGVKWELATFWKCLVDLFEIPTNVEKKGFLGPKGHLVLKTLLTGWGNNCRDHCMIWVFRYFGSGRTQGSVFGRLRGQGMSVWTWVRWAGSIALLLACWPLTRLDRGQPDFPCWLTQRLERAEPKMLWDSMIFFQGGTHCLLVGVYKALTFLVVFIFYISFCIFMIFTLLRPSTPCWWGRQGFSPVARPSGWNGRFVSLFIWEGGISLPLAWQNQVVDILAQFLPYSLLGKFLL